MKPYLRTQPSVPIKEDEKVVGWIHFQPIHKRIAQKIRNIVTRLVAILKLTVIFGSVGSVFAIIVSGLIN
jgi:hypothetical protein